MLKEKIQQQIHNFVLALVLAAVIFETGAMPTLTKSRNPTICG